MILASPNNSSAAPLSCETCAEILVRRGDRMPLVPRQLLRLRLDVATGDRGAFGASLLAQSSQVARGDENNRDRNGPVPGFALVNVDGRLGLAGDWELFFSIDNLLDRRSAGFGTLGRNEFTAPGGGFDATGAGWRSEQFRTAGAPRAAWVGIAWRFGGTPGA